MQRFPDHYIESIKSSDGHLLPSSREIREVFRVHFRDRFAHLPDLPLQEFRRYLIDFPRLPKAEAAAYKGLVTECEVRDVLKQVSLNNSPRLDGLPNEMYSWMLWGFRN